jgi:hypothetical protein
LQPYFSLGLSNASAVDITLRIGWPQLELGAFVTSPIRTTTVAVTRAADVVTIAGFGTWFTAGAGTIFADGIAHATQVLTNAVLQIDDGTVSNRLILIIDGTGDVSAATILTASAGQTAFTGNAAAGYNKTAMAYATNDAAFSLNGATAQTDALVTLPAGLTTARLGSNIGSPWSGYLRRVSYWNTRLTNAQLQALTT